MTKKQLRMFGHMLERRRAALLAEAMRTVGGMSHAREEFPDPADRAALEGDRNVVLRIRDRERKLLLKIDEALERIANGTYGICEGCGEPIGVGRLRARPVTTLCIACKETEEAKERARRGS
ncbi:MAG: RNA polymerase-binding transcription factor DksA [Candidatus Binatia bacterium]|nr:MAG: RNA polymerase-binding transcription factor DksA [Candidatus Binatia bacterium]